MEKKKTTINVLKQHIQDAIEKAVVDNHYESGYKQCLIDIQNKIDDGLLQMEKEQITDSYIEGHSIYGESTNAESYYNETYGGNNSEITMNNQSITFPYVCASCNKEMVAGGFPKWFCLQTTCNGSAYKQLARIILNQ